MLKCVLTAVHIHETAALGLGINMKLFDIAVAAGGPLTASELAEKALADALLVGQCGPISSQVK